MPPGARFCDAVLTPAPRPVAGDRRFFVTSEAKGYAAFMHSIRSRLAGFCALAALCVALGDGTATGAVLYRWVDSDGIVHYADRPAPGAEKVQIASAQSYKSPPAPSAASPRAANKSPASKYSRVAITSPTDGQSFVNSGGHVDAAAAVEPGLATGHQLWFELDGTRQPEPAGATFSTSFELGRGTHTLAAVVTDDQGHDVVSSAAVTFYVLQHSIAQPPRGPLLTPPKKN